MVDSKKKLSWLKNLNACLQCLIRLCPGLELLLSTDGATVKRIDNIILPPIFIRE